jgi:hypothetical protein
MSYLNKLLVPIFCIIPLTFFINIQYLPGLVLLFVDCVPKPVPSAVKEGGNAGEHFIKNPRLSWPGCQYLAMDPYPGLWSDRGGLFSVEKAAAVREGDPNLKPLSFQFEG